MRGEGRPTGITYEDVKNAAARGGSVDFEGRKVWVVSLNTKSEIGALHTEQLELHLSDEYVTLLGYWSGDGEFMETGRERPF
jgi:hypothetical protein